MTCFSRFDILLELRLSGRDEILGIVDLRKSRRKLQTGQLLKALLLSGTVHDLSHKTLQPIICGFVPGDQLRKEEHDSPDEFSHLHTGAVGCGLSEEADYQLVGLFGKESLRQGVLLGEEHPFVQVHLSLCFGLFLEERTFYGRNVAIFAKMLKHLPQTSIVGEFLLT